MAIGVPGIVTHLCFDKEAVEAANLYVSVFPGSKIDRLDRVKGTPSGDCDIVAFTLAGKPFMAISGGPTFKFNEAISLLVPCDTQEEIDHYWSGLAADPAAGRCGWIKDRFGLSWQIWPKALGEMMASPDGAARGRATAAMMASKKFDIAELRRAFAGP